MVAREHMSLSLFSRSRVHTIENYRLKRVCLSFRNAHFSDFNPISERLSHGETSLCSKGLTGLWCTSRPAPSNKRGMLPSRAC